MVPVNKEEKIAILNRYPKTQIVRTMRQHSRRHRYYCEEAQPVMRFLSELRRRDVVETHGSGKKSKRNRA